MDRTCPRVFSDERSRREGAMRKSIRRFAVLVLPLALLTARAATAAPVLSARSLACGGTGPQSGSIAATERAGVLTLRFRAAGLVPGQPVTCGHTCGMVFTGGPAVSCGTVGANGRFAARVDLPLGVCFGFIPFFDTPTTGKCVPSAMP
jgi:hypothetical protein